MEQKNLLESFRGLKPQELMAKIQETSAASKQSQEQVLMDILQTAKDCEYGRKYGFADIHSVEEFREKVPVTEYADYLEMIERMEMGAEDVLFPGKTAVFLNTSGTTGKSKYIPESEKGGFVKSLVTNVRMMKIAMEYPKIMSPAYKVLAIINSAVYGTTKGGIPVGSASGQSTKSGQSSGGMGEKMPLPAPVLSYPNLSSEVMDYLTILYASSYENISALMCNNVAHFNMLMKKFNAGIEQFLGDMREGTISIELPEQLREQLAGTWKANPQRADRLQEIFDSKGEIKAEDLWPEFDFVGCWMSASVGRTLEEFKYLFPDKTMYFDWGYGASEGKFNVPMVPNQSGGLIAAFGYFFEFLPVGGKQPVLLQETRDGEKYELIVTSYSGFYRYNIHDIVRITINDDGSRNMEFVCKSADKIVIDGNTLYSGDLTDIMEEYEQKKNIRIRLFQGLLEEKGLHLFVEPIHQLDQADFETYVRERLSEYGIALTDLTYKEDGYRDSLFTRSLQNGKTVNQTKLPVFITK